MAPAFVNGIAALIFIVFQIVTAVLTVVIRYHFKRFAVTGDRRADRITAFMTWGTAVFGVTALILLLAGIAS